MSKKYTVKFKIIREQDIEINDLYHFNWSNVAKRLGVSRQYLYRVLNGYHTVSFEFYCKLKDLVANQNIK